MAPKLVPKRVPPEELPSASSSSASEEDEQMTDKEEEDQTQEQTKEDAESEQEEEEGSEDDEEEGEEKNKPSLQKPTSITTKRTQPLSSSESDDDRSDSEIHSTHTQPSPTASDFTVKPIASKPMDNATKPKKPTSKAAAKRRAADSEKNGKESQKNKKTKISNGDEEEKKYGGAINRLWSEDDEIVILKGMVDYQSKKGADPNADLGEFHEFIKKSLHVDVSKSQFMDKIRRLKKKYRNNAEKLEDPVFSKPHEHKCFELSKKIWGGGKDNSVADGNGKSGSKRARKIVKVNNPVASPQENVNEIGVIEGFKDEIKDTMVDKVEDFWSMFPCLKHSLEMETSSCLSMNGPVKDFIVARMSLIGNAKAMDLEKKWKNLLVDEVALYLKRVELIKEQTKLMLDAMKASKV